MSVNQKIIAAVGALGLPVVPGVDGAHRDRVITFNYELIPAQWADDRPRYWRALIQVHLMLPPSENGLALKGALAKALADHGFIWPEIADATDQEGQHYVFETEQIMKLEGLP